MSHFKSHMAMLRKKSGKSIREVADDAGVSKSVVERAERPTGATPIGGSVLAILEHGYGLMPDNPLHKKALKLWVAHKTNDRMALHHDNDVDTMESRLRKLTFEQLGVIKRIMDNPRVIKRVSRLLDELLPKQ